MNLIELTTVPLSALPVAQFRDYLRLGTGFSDDSVQDDVLETCLRAALGAAEARTGKAFLARDFRLTITQWRDGGKQTLPVAPVSAVSRFALIDFQDVETLMDADTYGLEPDAHRPALIPAGGYLPTIAEKGRAEIDFTAGFGAVWSDVPAQLQKASLMLAAHFYEHRHAMAFEEDGIPSVVSALLAPFMTIRLFGGRGS